MHAMKMSCANSSSNLSVVYTVPPSTTPRPGLPGMLEQERAIEAALGAVDQNRMTLAIYQGLLDKDPWRVTVEHLSVHMAASAIIVIRPSSSTDLGFIACHPRNPEIEHAYRALYWTQDPFLDLPIDQVLTIDEYLGADAWLASDFYRNFIGQGGVRYGLGINIVSQNGTVCRLRLYRLPEQPAFTQQDKDRLRDLVAHFNQALSLATRIERNETQSELYEGALDRLHIGAIVLDENQHILRCNQIAKSMLDEGDGLKQVAGGLEAHYRNDRTTLRELVAASDAKAQAMSISRPSGKRKLGVVIKSIPLREASEGKGRSAWIIFVCDPDAQTTAPREILRQVFDFTPAEAALAMELANGLSLDEAAELLGIRRNTARTHLRAIFAKAGVTRQAELVRLVLNGVVGLSGLSPVD